MLKEADGSYDALEDDEDWILYLNALGQCAILFLRHRSKGLRIKMLL